MKNFIIVICISLISMSSVYAFTTDEIKQNIVKQAKTMGVEPEIVLSIAKTESGFRQSILSIVLCQITTSISNQGCNNM